MSASFDVTSLTAMRANPSFSQIDGRGIGIAVLDTGVDALNPDLQSNVVGFYNAVTDPVNTPIDTNFLTDAFDHEGHGSHVSGIAASSNPQIGVADAAHLVDIRVFADANESQLGGDPILRGLQWVELNYQSYNIKAVNMSLGESGVNLDSVTAQASQDAEAVEITKLESLGITVVSASGNSYANDPTAGASFPAIVSTISVANTWSDNGQTGDFGVPFGQQGDNYGAVDYSATPDTLASTSQRSTLSNQVAAPGEDIYSTWNGSDSENGGSDLLHNTISGTSMASPFVAGMVALMQDAAKTFGGHYLNPSDVLRIIKQTSDTIVDSNNPDNARYSLVDGSLTNLPETGLSFRRVNVLRAMQEVKAEMTGSSGGVGLTPGPDTDNTIAKAIGVPVLDGTRTFSLDGNIGTDGLVLVGNNDIDLFKVVVAAPGQISIGTSLPSGATGFSASLRLFSSTGTLLDHAEGTADAYPSLSTSQLATGTYYVGISSLNNLGYNASTGAGVSGGTAQGDYLLTVGLLNPDPNGIVAGAASLSLTNPTELYTDPFSGRDVPDVIQNGTLGSDPPPVGGTTRITVNSDVDMYQLVAPDTGIIDLVTDTTQYFSPADTFLKAWVQNTDGSLTALGSNDDTFGTDAALRINVQIGKTYFVAVTVPDNVNLDPTTPYVGRVPGATPSDVSYDLHLIFDNGDVNGTAINPVDAVIAQTLNGTIGADNGVALLGANSGFKDVDFFNYAAAQDGLFDVTATSQTNGFTPVVSLWEFTPGQTSIIKIADTSGASSPHLIAEVNAGDSFFVAVTGLGNNNFNWFAIASGTGGQIGNYQLSTTLHPLSELASFSDSSLDTGTPQVINVGDTAVKGNVGLDGPLVVGPSDIDLYRLTATQTQTLNIRTFTSQEGDADTVLRVFNSNGDQIAGNDNLDQTTTASLVHVHVIAGQTYYIGIDGASSNAMAYSPFTGAGAAAGSTGNYSLSVTAAPNSLAVSNAPVQNEPYPGTGTFSVFTITLDAALTQAVTVDYTTADGTAKAGTDYTTTSGTLTFAAGETSMQVSVPLLSGVSGTANKTFVLQLANSSGAPIAVTQGSATIKDVQYTALNFGAGNNAVYTDQGGRHVTLSLGGLGTGVALFANGALNPLRIDIENSVLSTLNIKGSGASIGDLVVNGSLKAISAKGINLTGDLTASGPIGKITLGDAGVLGTQHTISLTSGVTSFTLGHAADLSITTTGLISMLSVIGWTDSLAPVDTITAASVSQIKSKGDFNASVAAGVIGTVKITGSLAGGIWNVASIKNLSVTGGITGAAINLSATAGLGLGVLSAKGAVSGTQIRAAANIGKVTVGSFADSLLFAGITESLSALPSAIGDFLTPDTIVSVTVKSGPFSNTNIAADSIGKVTIKGINESNNTTPFGVAAHTLKSITAPPIKWNDKLDPSLLILPTGDFTVRLI